MTTQTTTRIESVDLKAQITAHIQELAEATDAARLSQAMLEYLDMTAKFHKYSPHNIMLILMACPDASMVAGFKKWRMMQRYVRKGERGIPILAPVLVKVEAEKDDGESEEKEILVGFKVVYVFDVSQTDGEPLPEPPNWKSPERNALLQEQLMHFAESKVIEVEVRELQGDTQGASLGGKIWLSPQAGTKTLIHELAHELLHHEGDSMPDRTIRELEAESVAYVVAKHFGLQDLASPNYVALHGADAELIMAHLERIRRTAAEIIASIQSAD